MLFCPNEELKESGTTPALCVTNVGDDGKAVLSIENHSMHPVNLEHGEVLGTLELVHEVTTVGAVNTVRTKQGSQEPGMRPEERMNQLLSELNMEKTLSEQKLNQLKAVLSSFSDVFALDQSELGRTDLIKHCIDTGGQGPVKQLPYRTPFSLHERWKA